MLSVQDRLCVDEREVAAKLIDGEAIIINLATGMYYSLDKTGAAVWSLLATAHNIDETVTILSEHYRVDRTQAVEHVQQLANDLLEQKLLHVSADRTAPVETVQLDQLNGDGYEKPTLNAYSDMGDILALDPPLPQVEEPASDD